MPVKTAVAVKADVPLVLDAFGTVQPVAQVAVKSQVSEVLRKVHFEPGDKVERGALLFTIDSRPVSIALQRANATLAKDKIQAANLKADADRARTLVGRQMTAQTDADKAIAAEQAMFETVKADAAAVAALQVDLDHCRVTAPIAGRAGNVLVDAGNLVQANGETLVELKQISPIRVFFSVPQAQLEAIRTWQARGALEVDATLPHAPDRPEGVDRAELSERGQLTFINNTVDPTTGTIQLAATFENADEHLWPGRYVRVQLRLTVQSGALVVPARAVVESGSEGAYVFVIQGGAQGGASDARTAAMRKVKIDRASGDDVVVASGLSAGDVVVIDGQAQLEDGTKVESVSDPTTPTP